MPRYTCDPEVMLNGTTVSALMHSIQHENYIHIVQKYGLVDVDPKGWYPLQKVLDVFNEITELPGARMDFVSVGIAAADLSPLPPEVEALSAHEFFKLYERVYPQRHQGGNPGEVRVQVHDPDHITLVFDNPYPSDVMYGLMYGYARRFARGRAFHVEYDESTPPDDVSGKPAVIHVVFAE